MKRAFIIFMLLINTMFASSQVREGGNKPSQSKSHFMKSAVSARFSEVREKAVSTGSSIPLMPGWPVKVGFWPEYPVAADLDGDGKKEVIISDSGPYDAYLHVFTCDGKYFSSGWPKRLASDLSAPAGADIDNDGILEIIVVAGDDFRSSYWPNGSVHVLKPDGSYVEGWPFILDGAHNWINSVSIGDINNDGMLDIITATGITYGLGGDSSIYYRKIYAFDAHGTPLPGWPVEPDSNSGRNRLPRSPLVLVDLDKDGFLEIISGFLDKDDPNGGYNAIYALNHDGTTLPGFPIITETWNYSLASADMDGDGEYEIYSEGIRYNRWGVRDYTWEEKPLLSDLAFADVNQDGLPELIYGWGKVHVVDVYGNELSGWPVKTREGGDIVDGNPVAGDIDGDGDIEILIGSYYTNKVFAWHHDGKPVEGFPVTTTSWNDHIAISDLDGDGDIELISACSDSFIYVWDIPSKGPCTKMEWPVFQHDERHTGTYPLSSTPVVEKESSLPEGFELEQNFPNPFNSETRISFTLPFSLRVRVTVYSVSGQRVRTLVDGFRSQGHHTVCWDGRDSSGTIVCGGVYIVRLTAGRYSAERKIVFLR